MADSLKTHILDLLKQPSVKIELQMIMNYILNVVFQEISPFVYAIFAFIFMIFLMNLLMCIGGLIILYKFKNCSSHI
jgi:hypothetical protein